MERRFTVRHGDAQCAASRFSDGGPAAAFALGCKASGTHPRSSFVHKPRRPLVVAVREAGDLHWNRETTENSRDIRLAPTDFAGSCRRHWDYYAALPVTGIEAGLSCLANLDQATPVVGSLPLVFGLRVGR